MSYRDVVFFPMWRRNLRPSGWCGRRVDSTLPQPFHRYLPQVGVLTSPLKWGIWGDSLLRKYSYLTLFLVIVGKLKPSQPPAPLSLDLWVQNHFCLCKIGQCIMVTYVLRMITNVDFQHGVWWLYEKLTLFFLTVLGSSAY